MKTLLSNSELRAAAKPRDWLQGALLATIAATSTHAQGSAPAIATDSPAVLQHVERAKALAGADLQTPLFLCRADSGAVVRQALDNGSSQWLEPTRLFDNLFFVGNRFVGVFILKTSQGLILFDSSSSPDEARDHLVPGIVKLGLDPKSIRYVIVTHGHWDHFGGAAWLQKTYGARIGLSEADWDLIEHTPPDSPGIGGHAKPTRDLVVRDGQVLELGDTKITLSVTPGHTPGAVSAIIPGREKGKTYPLSLLGSVAFPPSLEPTATTGGLLAYERSIQRFAQISHEAGAVGILNTHAFADGGLARIDAATNRGPSAPNPILIGAAATDRYYALFDECLKAAIARPHGPDDSRKPTVPPKS
jgi:metallo-beta-lactamase class B